MNIVCANITRYRQEQGLKQKELADILGVNFKTLSGWENGRSNPDLMLLPSICRALHITLDQLYGIHSSSRSVSEQLHMDMYRRLSPAQQRYINHMTEELYDLMDVQEEAPNLIRLVLFDRSLAAGVDFDADLEQEGRPVWLYSSPAIEQADYIFSVSGDSMEPEYHDGDRVLVRKQDSLAYGQVGAFMIGNEQYIKKYEADGLHSLNKKYPVMTPEAYGDIRIIGRVTGVLNKNDYASEEDIRRAQS